MLSAQWIAPYEAVAEAVVKLFYPHVEVVIHDVAADTVVRVWNPVSARRPGDPSLLEPELLARLGEGLVIGPYRKTGLRGEPVTAVSVVIGGGRGLLCVNFDRSVLAAAAASLEAIAGVVGQDRPAALFERDWREELNALVHDWCQAQNVNVGHLSPAQRGALMGWLDDKGAFGVRRATAHLGTILGVSRATIYATLRAARGSTP